MKINFSLNKETCRFKNDIENMYKVALEEIGISQNILVNIALVSGKQIKLLNKNYRGIDRETDVLSFPMLSKIEDIVKEPDFYLGQCNIGDIYINLEKAKQQAIEYGHSLKREFCYLALHGFLHLAGYDHIDPQDEIEMLNIADKVLNKVNIGRE